MQRLEDAPCRIEKAPVLRHADDRCRSGHLHAPIDSDRSARPFVDQQKRFLSVRNGNTDAGCLALVEVRKRKSGNGSRPMVFRRLRRSFRMQQTTLEPSRTQTLPSCVRLTPTTREPDSRADMDAPCDVAVTPAKLR